MDDETALLRAICEQPDEDTPRLVFADWLTERGDAVSTGWAAAVRAQVARAAGEEGVAEPDFFRSQEYVDYVSTRLGVPAQLDARLWERGFPLCIDGDFWRISAAWPRLLARVPFRRLRLLHASDDAVTEFVTWAGLRRLTDLELRSWRSGHFDPPFHEPALRALAACRALSGLVSLTLDQVALTDAGAAAVLDSPHLSGLKVLRFTHVIGAGLTALTRARLTSAFGASVIG